ncbi:RING-H2 finger protein ATL5-like [Vigna radiata var. radiata]|uniref:RING-H2 finger protein ATL5-like n=1 Tax=Vigna radiata var. radiata TaxID=3916 RepID=A0A1S3TMP3_VIGRR|nr:RING-H2 finger protein ATL5-like [Vigna radiata var. radiata]
MTTKPDIESEFAYTFMVGIAILLVLLIILIVLFNVCVRLCRRCRGALLSRSLPAFSFSATVHGSLQECAVCLSEFADGDKVRALPNCKHGFHTHCIDLWFACNSTCPLCRTPAQPIKGCPDNEPGSVPVSEAEEGCSSSLGPPIACPREALDVIVKIC